MHRERERPEASLSTLPGQRAKGLQSSNGAPPTEWRGASPLRFEDRGSPFAAVGKAKMQEQDHSSGRGLTVPVSAQRATHESSLTWEKREERIHGEGDTLPLQRELDSTSTEPVAFAEQHVFSPGPFFSRRPAEIDATRGDTGGDSKTHAPSWKLASATLSRGSGAEGPTERDVSDPLEKEINPRTGVSRAGPSSSATLDLASFFVPTPKEATATRFSRQLLRAADATRRSHLDGASLFGETATSVARFQTPWTRRDREGDLVPERAPAGRNPAVPLFPERVAGFVDLAPSGRERATKAERAKTNEREDTEEDGGSASVPRGRIRLPALEKAPFSTVQIDSNALALAAGIGGVLLGSGLSNGYPLAGVHYPYPSYGIPYYPPDCAIYGSYPGTCMLTTLQMTLIIMSILFCLMLIGIAVCCWGRREDSGRSKRRKKYRFAIPAGP